MNQLDGFQGLLVILYQVANGFGQERAGALDCEMLETRQPKLIEEVRVANLAPEIRTRSGEVIARCTRFFGTFEGERLEIL